jgi:alpha-tubulin suppressor-like RCC1 family protein
MKYFLYKIFILGLFANCSSSDDKTTIKAIEANTIDQTIIKADNPRKTYARLSASSTKTQVLKASSQSDLSGVEVSFPPGCISTNSDTVEVSLEEGADKYFETGVSDFEQIASDNVLEHESSMLLQSSDDSLDFSCEFNIDFPASNTANLHLTEENNHVLFYHVFDKDIGAYISGFKNIAVSDGLAKIKASRLGAYQLLSFKETLAEDIENLQSSQKNYITKSQSSSTQKTDDKSQVIIDQKNIIVGGSSQTGQAPSEILFDEAIDFPSVKESSPEGIQVSKLSIVDGDNHDTFTFFITGQDKEYFYIKNSILYVGKVFKYKDGASKEISISVVDSFGNTYSKDISIPVLNRHPTDVLFDGEEKTELSIPEHLDIDAVASVLTVVDPDSSEGFSFSISGSGSEFFYIDNQETISLKIKKEISSLTNYSFPLEITVQDYEKHELKKDIVINIIDLEPEIILSSNSVYESKYTNILVGKLSSKDPSVTYSLVEGQGDNNNNDFTIIDNFLLTNKAFDYEQGDNTKYIRIKVQETFLSSEKTFEITISDITSEEELAVVTWGDSDYGGDSSSVVSSLKGGIEKIFSTESAFAALKSDSSVVTWGNPDKGGDSSAVSLNLSSGVVDIFSTNGAFAALKSDGSVVTWGDFAGGNSDTVASDISSGVVKISSADYAFAALKSDGSVITWGLGIFGGDSSLVADDIESGVSEITSADISFAALKTDGSVITWGKEDQGGDSSAVASKLTAGVTKIFSSGWGGAFAALKADGSVVTWGNVDGGGDSSSVASDLTADVVNIFGKDFAFAALKENGSVITWGSAPWGGDSSSVASDLSSGVIKIFSTESAFAALKDDNSVVTWGFSSLDNLGGDSSAVASNLTSGVTEVFSTQKAFAALKTDGSVVTWGNSDFGGDSSSVSSNISSGVVKIFSTNSAFAALKSNGSVFTWGNTEQGGDSSSVSLELNGGITNIFSTERSFSAIRE